MKARVIANQTPVGQRSRLADALPLDTPYLVQIFPVYACNFKCGYCVFAVPRTERGYVSDAKTMDVALYKKCIDDLRLFPRKLRMLRFAGTGEPLLHPAIAEMVDYAARAQVADSIDIVTNGSQLSRRMSDDLVNAGVSRIRISIQGANSGKYRETTQNYADLDRIVENVTYLYGVRAKTEVYVKIIDCALDSAGDEQTFYRLFGDIADVVAVEHLLPATPLIDYSRIQGVAAMDKTQNGAELMDSEICPQPFYMLQINPDGVVVPCCGMESPLKIAHAGEASLPDIWSGRMLNSFRRAMLSGQRGDNRVCAKCAQYKHAMFPEDQLDEQAARLLSAYAE